MTTIPQVLSDERIVQIGHRMAWRYKRSSDPAHSDTYTFNRACLLDFTRAVAEALAAPSPVAPVLPAVDALPSERSAAFLDWWHEHGRKLCITPECAEYVFEAGRAALSQSGQADSTGGKA